MPLINRLGGVSSPSAHPAPGSAAPPDPAAAHHPRAAADAARAHPLRDHPRRGQAAAAAAPPPRPRAAAADAREAAPDRHRTLAALLESEAKSLLQQASRAKESSQVSSHFHDTRL